MSTYSFTTTECHASAFSVHLGDLSARVLLKNKSKMATEMIADGEGAFRASYIGERSDEQISLLGHPLFFSV